MFATVSLEPIMRCPNEYLDMNIAERRRREMISFNNGDM